MSTQFPKFANDVSIPLFACWRCQGLVFVIGALLTCCKGLEASCTRCTHLELLSPVFNNGRFSCSNQRFHDFFYVWAHALLRNCAMLPCPLFLFATTSPWGYCLEQGATPTRDTHFNLLLLMSIILGSHQPGLHTLISRMLKSCQRAH